MLITITSEINPILQCNSTIIQIQINKYSHLSPYSFTPLSIKTMGAVDPKSRHFLKELGTRIMKRTGDPHSYSYLMQHLCYHTEEQHGVSFGVTWQGEL